MEVRKIMSRKSGNALGSIFMLWCYVVKENREEKHNNNKNKKGSKTKIPDIPRMKVWVNF